MTVKNAIKICDSLVEHYTKHTAGIRDKVKDWDPDGVKSLALTFADTIDDIAACILVVKSQIQPKCKHPKKMRDGKKGQRYCMGCNMDMED